MEENILSKIFRLCYVDDDLMYFTDNFANCIGDDWNDSPYEHNAGTPYEYIEEWSDAENKEHGHTHLRIFAFERDYRIIRPCDNYTYNSPYSVEDINNGAIAWLFQDEAGGLMGGATIKETKEWMKKAKVRFGELKL